MIAERGFDSMKKLEQVSDIINKEKDEGEIFVNTDLENKGAIFRKKV